MGETATRRRRKARAIAPRRHRGFTRRARLPGRRIHRGRLVDGHGVAHPAPYRAGEEHAGAGGLPGALRGATRVSAGACGAARALREIRAGCLKNGSERLADHEAPPGERTCEPVSETEARHIEAPDSVARTRGDREAELGLDGLPLPPGCDRLDRRIEYHVEDAVQTQLDFALANSPACSAPQVEALAQPHEAVVGHFVAIIHPGDRQLAAGQAVPAVPVTVLFHAHAGPVQPTVDAA